MSQVHGVGDNAGYLMSSRILHGLVGYVVHGWTCRICHIPSRSMKEMMTRDTGPPNLKAPSGTMRQLQNGASRDFRRDGRRRHGLNIQ